MPRVEHADDDVSNLGLGIFSGLESPDGLGDYLTVNDGESTPSTVAIPEFAARPGGAPAPAPIPMPARAPAAQNGVPQPAAVSIQRPTDFVRAVPQPGFGQNNAVNGKSWSAGVTLVLAAASAGIGAIVGGPWGAVSGAFLAGGVRNAVRATGGWYDADPNVRTEARKSAAVAVVGLAAGAYFGYRAYQREI